MDNYSAELIYRPPLNCPPALEAEFGSIQPIRLFTQADIETTECIDCEARSHLNTLYQLGLDDPDCFDRLREALIFVLENTDWPVGN